MQRHQFNTQFLNQRRFELFEQGRIWQRAPLAGKREMLVRIFPGKLVFANGNFRTSPLSPIIGLLGSKKADNEEERPFKKDRSPVWYTRQDAGSNQRCNAFSMVSCCLPKGILIF